MVGSGGLAGGGAHGDGAVEAGLGETHGLSEWIGRLLVSEAARQRAQGYWLRRQAEEEGTFGGVLADLAERATPVAVQVSNGRRHRATIAALGTDFVVLHTGTREVLVQLTAISSVQTLPREHPTLGDRPVVGSLTMAEALSGLAEHRPRVLLVGADPLAPVSGELRAVGRDLAQVRLDGGGTAYVALASVLEMSAAESG